MVDNVIYGLSCDAEVLFESQSYARAIELNLKAYRLIPEPRELDERSIFITTSIGDCFYEQERFADALPWFMRSVVSAPRSTKPLSLPFAKMRLGQVYYQLGQTEKAQVWLRAAIHKAPKQMRRIVKQEGLHFIELVDGPTVPDSGKTDPATTEPPTTEPTTAETQTTELKNDEGKETDGGPVETVAEHKFPIHKASPPKLKAETEPPEEEKTAPATLG
jgi:tetratricopeptide (TPR) repeat protein